MSKLFLKDKFDEFLHTAESFGRGLEALTSRLKDAGLTQDDWRLLVRGERSVESVLISSWQRRRFGESIPRTTTRTDLDMMERFLSQYRGAARPDCLSDLPLLDIYDDNGELPTVDMAKVKRLAETLFTVEIGERETRLMEIAREVTDRLNEALNLGHDFRVVSQFTRWDCDNNKYITVPDSELCERITININNLNF